MGWSLMSLKEGGSQLILDAFGEVRLQVRYVRGHPVVSRPLSLLLLTVSQAPPRY